MIRRTTGFDVRAFVQQQFHDFKVAILRSHKEASYPVRALISSDKYRKQHGLVLRTTGFDVRVVVQQELHDIEVAVLRSNIEAGCAPLV